ncbi:MAG: ATPase, partial [Arthrobacter sp.]
MTMTSEQAEWFAETFEKLTANVGQAVLGKNQVVRLVLTAMLAEGHVLLEDAPGTGKTML